MPHMSERLLPALSQFVVAQAIADWRYFLAEQRAIDLSINLPISFLDDPASFKYLCGQIPHDPAFEGLILEVDGNELTRDLSMRARSPIKLGCARSQSRLNVSATDGPHSFSCAIFLSLK